MLPLINYSAKKKNKAKKRSRPNLNILMKIRIQKTNFLTRSGLLKKVVLDKIYAAEGREATELPY